ENSGESKEQKGSPSLDSRWCSHCTQQWRSVNRKPHRPKTTYPLHRLRMRTCFKLSPTKTVRRRTTFTTISRRVTVPCGPSCVSVGRERTRLVAYSTKASE